jgi:hypothetical protein
MEAQRVRERTREQVVVARGDQREGFLTQNFKQPSGPPGYKSDEVFVLYNDSTLTLGHPHYIVETRPPERPARCT